MCDWISVAHRTFVAGAGLEAICRMTALGVDLKYWKRSRLARPASGQRRLASTRKAVGLDTREDEKWLETELEFLSILVEVLKGLKRPNGSE